MDSDEEDFVFVGTPIEREEENTSRKKKALAEASGQLRTLVPWKQEVRDEEGRRRFHGAFTGGFSAGYYNSVGSKEGWTPQTFTSSRKNRAEIKRQDILSFLDDDEKAEMEGNVMGTSSQFDTFGFTAAESARKQAENDQKKRPAPIPGPIPDEIVLPASDSIGVKLLVKMGWRRGRSIKDSHVDSLRGVRREGRKAFLALSSQDVGVQEGGSEEAKNEFDALAEDAVEAIQNKSSGSTPVYVRQPKQDMHGLGYDPYKHAPEFREKKNSGLSGSKESGGRRPFSVRDDLLSSRSGRLAPGFGIGALEELDVEDEDVFSSGYNFEETYVQEVEEPSRLAIEDKQISVRKDQGVFPRFQVASKSDYQLERFNPPDVPKDFVPHHKFPAPLHIDSQVGCPPPAEVLAPEDNNLRVMVEGVASLVARCGKLFEDLSREKNKSNPLFSFLSGGSGSEYYARRLWEEQQKRHGQTKLLSVDKPSADKQKMTAEARGKVLGEKPLDRSSKELSSGVTSSDDVQYNLTDTFTKPESFNELLETAKPFKDDPAKQERFEQFLKDKYRGGLRSTYSSGASYMSESARARERLDFEAAAESIEKSKRGDKGKLPAQELLEFAMNSRLQFTSAGVEEKSIEAEELASKKLYPKREEFQWRPAPVLCKRFDLTDPYMGKPPAAPRIRSKMDSLIFTPDSAKNTKMEAGANSQSGLSQFNSNDTSSLANDAEADAAIEPENVERPVDLYKAIFSDDSDIEEETSIPNQANDPQKKTEAASATFSRLVAGDFLESLGKQLGLEVPPDLPSSTKPPAPRTTDVTEPDTQNIARPSDGSPKEDAKLNENVDQHDERDKPRAADSKARRSSGQHDPDSGGSSSEHERSKKRSRRHRRRSASSDSDSSDYDRDRRRSHSKDEKKRSRDKSRRRKHSSSHKRSREDSPDRRRDRDRTERKEKHRRRD